MNRGCYGCFGPHEATNAPSLSSRLGGLGMPDDDIMRVFRTFNAWADPFREESEADDASDR